MNEPEVRQAAETLALNLYMAVDAMGDDGYRALADDLMAFARAVSAPSVDPNHDAPEVPDPAATIAELRLRLENGESVVFPKMLPGRAFSETRAMAADWKNEFNADGRVLVTDPHASKVIVRPGTVRVTPPESLAHLMPAEGGMP